MEKFVSEITSLMTSMSFNIESDTYPENLMFEDHVWIAGAHPKLLIPADSV